MKRLIDWFCRPLTTRKLPRARRVTPRLALEKLEGRWVPASLGTKYAALDFDGEYISSAQMAEGDWAGYGAQSFSGFKSLFTNARAWLDMNYDGNVNATDADLAVSYVKSKVQADYRPYKVSIFEQDQDNSQGYLTDNFVGDVSVMITGTADFLVGGSAWGVAPSVNVNNNDDEIVFVFAGGSVDSFGTDRYQWLNQVARTVSHEMGHAFGLDHEVSEYGSLSDALSHSIMGTPNRDWTRDFVFQDRYFTTGSGSTQNAHRHLLREDILGRSSSTYLAVLSPGVLTVSGNSAANSISVYKYSDTTWEVIIDGVTTYVNLNSYSVHSLNPFDQPITSLKVVGEAGNDTIYVSVFFTATTYLYGDAGNDSIYGGAGTDYVYAGDGNDYVSAYTGNDWVFGGAGNDTIYGGSGDDWLFGQDGDDEIYGGSGYDRAYGGNGSDYLDPDNEYRDWS